MLQCVHHIVNFDHYMEQIKFAVSENLRLFREERSLSYDQLADLTGVSKSMLRRIEMGNSNPTISTVWKIANGLKIPFTALVTSLKQDIQVKSFKEASPLIENDKGYRLFPLTVFDPERPFESYYVEIDPQVVLDAEPHQGNPEEHVFVLQGELEITIAGESYIVQQQQFVSFRADCEHRYRNNGSEPAFAFMIISYLP